MHACSLTNSQMILKICWHHFSISTCKNSQTSSLFTIATHQATLILSLTSTPFIFTLCFMSVLSYVDPFFPPHPFHECFELCWSSLSSSPHFMSAISYIDPLSNALILSSPSPLILIMSTSAFPNCSPSGSSPSYVNPLLVFNQSS
jgi:hypothetical protein